MTPQEKAFDLFNQYLKILGGINSKDWIYFHGNEAKQSALIAVDEILNYTNAHGFISLTEYYIEVKHEIEKL